MYFDRDDVALPHFSCFFLERSVKEREQAEKLLEYQNLRGGRILLQTIAVSTACSRPPKNSSFLGLSSKRRVFFGFGLFMFQKPTREDWRGGLDAMSFSLDYQKSLNTCILDMHRRAGSHTDPHVSL